MVLNLPCIYGCSAGGDQGQGEIEGYFVTETAHSEAPGRWRNAELHEGRRPHDTAVYDRHGEWICAIRDQRAAPAEDARPGAYGRESSSGAPVGEHAALEPADGPVWRGCPADGCAD